MRRTVLATPIGWLAINVSHDAIKAVNWQNGPEGENPVETPLMAEARRQLLAYFAGTLQTFDLPLAPDGTPFQQKVWQAIAAIPYRQTRDYGDIARVVGSAPRPVGGACGKNPIPIIIPCHRVLGRNGLGGYSGAGGLMTKTTLLEHEARFPAA